MNEPRRYWVVFNHEGNHLVLASTRVFRDQDAAIAWDESDNGGVGWTSAIDPATEPTLQWFDDYGMADEDE